MAGGTTTKTVTSRKITRVVLFLSGIFLTMLPGLRGLHICLSKHVPFRGPDFILQFIPWWDYCADMLRAGNLPWWDASVMFGVPYLADPQSAVLYPLNWLFIFVPTVTALTILIVLHLWIAALFTMLWMRAQGVGYTAAVLAGLIYSSGGFITAHLFAGHYTLICSAAWIPAILWQIEIFFRTHQLKSIVWTGFFLGLQALAGHPQTSIITLAAMIVHIGFQNKKSVKRLNLLLISGVIAFFIAIAPFFLALELENQSVRSNSNPGFVATDALLVQSLGTFVLPDAYIPDSERDGAKAFPHEQFNYAGIFPLILSFCVSRKRFGQLAPLLVFSMMVSILPGIPGLDAVVSEVPVWRLFRGWARGMMIFTLGLAALSGHGLDALRKNKRVGFRVYSAAILFVLVSWVSQIFSHAVIVYFLKSAVLLGLSVILASLIRKYPHNVLYLSLGFVLTFADLFHIQQKLVSPADLFRENMQFVRDVSRVIQKVIPRDGTRVILVDMPLVVNYSHYFGVDTALGYRALPMARFQRYFNRAVHASPDTNQAYAVANRCDPMFSAGSVKWWVGNPRASDACNLIPLGPRLPVFRDGDALPRAWVVHHYAVHASADQVLDAISDPDWDPRNAVELESEPDSFPSGSDFSSGVSNVRYRVISATHTEVSVTSETPGFLVVTDTMYPGWRATIDGSAVRILRANYLFRAVQVPVGTHVVTFQYQPGIRFVFLFISLFCLLVTGILAVLPLTRRSVI